MGAQNTAAQRPPAQSALQVEKLQLPPSRRGPRRPRCLLHGTCFPLRGPPPGHPPPSRLGSPGQSMGMVGPPGGQAETQVILSEGSGRGCTETSGHVVGSREGREQTRWSPGERGSTSQLRGVRGRGSDRPWSRAQATACVGPHGGLSLRMRRPPRPLRAHQSRALTPTGTRDPLSQPSRPFAGGAGGRMRPAAGLGSHSWSVSEPGVHPSPPSFPVCCSVHVALGVHVSVRTCVRAHVCEHMKGTCDLRANGASARARVHTCVCVSVCSWTPPAPRGHRELRLSPHGGSLLAPGSSPLLVPVPARAHSATESWGPEPAFPQPVLAGELSRARAPRGFRHSPGHMGGFSAASPPRGAERARKLV